MGRGSRKDYDISDLIELCSAPSSIEERVVLLQEYAAIYPELMYFLVVGYFAKDSFSEITKDPIDYKPSKMSKGGSYETLATMWKEITYLYDTFESSVRIKRSKAFRLLCELHPEDAALVHSLLHGKFYSLELNEMVVAKAFPDALPKGKNFSDLG